MEEKDAEILLAFLKDILFQPSTEPIDVSQLSDPLKKLGMGMNILNQYIEELRDFSCNIAKGNLETKTPSKENQFCWPLKTLQANLLHLTWQTKQVAKGDYSQNVDFLGEFSVAFNSMVQQLQQREEMLREETERALEKALRLEEYNRLITRLMDSIDDWFIILDLKTGEVLFQNHAMQSLTEVEPELKFFLLEKLQNYDMQWYDWEIEYKQEVQKSRKFHIDSFRINFSDRVAIAYKITNITAQKEHELELEKFAFKDTNTDLYNRRFCMMKLKKLLEQNVPFSVCYIDLDHLKQVNDRFGHEEGDHYLKTLGEVLLRHFRNSDWICRIGGDEFVVIMKECSASHALLRLKETYDDFGKRGNGGLYPMSFSYGIQAVKSDMSITPEKILKEADQKMYLFKREYRKYLD